MDFADSVSRIRAGFGADAALEQTAASLAEMQADHEREQQRKVARWHADAPKREAASRASQAAYDRRRRELGLADDERIPIAAAVWMIPPDERMHIFGMASAGHLITTGKPNAQGVPPTAVPTYTGGQTGVPHPGGGGT